MKRYGLDEAKVQLLSLIKAQMSLRETVSSFPVLRREKVPLLEIDPWQWLVGFNVDRKVFFKSSDGALIVAGVGTCFEIESDSWHGLDGIWGQINDAVSASLDARFFLNMSFARTIGGGEWDGFPAIHVVLPAVEIVKDKEGCWLVANLMRGRDGESFDTTALDILEKMSWVEDVGSDDLAVILREDVPDYEEWQCSVEAVLDSLDRGDLQKVFLSRRVSLKLDLQKEFPSLLRKLLSMDNAGDIFLTALRDKVFISVHTSPVFHRCYTHVESSFAVVASTHKPKASTKEPILVTGAVVEVYRELCRFYQLDRHLDVDALQQVFKISGETNEGVSDKDFLQAFFPTASVSGVPAEKARHFLQQYEVFDRGWFAGPVGFLSQHETHLAVSTKACLWESSSLHLYVLAPFVKGGLVSASWDSAGDSLKEILHVLME